MISLAELADYCREKAGAAKALGIPEAERDLWQQLANEIDDYLTPSDDPALFDQPTRKAPPP